MILFRKAEDIRQYLDKQENLGKQLSFVPTMGALHPGHLSLLSEAKKGGGISVCSIFVNPTQFNDAKDFEKYPVTLDEDIKMLEEAGCDVLFIPSVTEIYPQGVSDPSRYELGAIESVLEGKYRPGHFQGVAMVVHRLLEIVMPHHLYMGQKDYQQCMVVAELIRITGLDKRVQLKVVPTMREKDGLAMSSRNMRLKKEERKLAVGIYETLQFINKNIAKEPFSALKADAAHRLTSKGFRVDYVEIADATTLETVIEWDGKQGLVALIAAYLNEVRLIDNLQVVQ